jgi:TonB-linked SusC/RagA family outer membrane protein
VLARTPFAAIAPFLISGTGAANMKVTRLARHVGRSLGVLAALAVSALQVSAQTANVTVNVKEEAGRPVDQAQVVVVGTTIGGLTNSEGRVVLRGVPAGSHVVRVLRVGFGEQKKPVTFTGEQQTLEFTLEPVAVSLAPVVTTATGAQRRVEIGNATTNIQAAKVVDQGSIASAGELLNARAAGVTVTGGTQTGTGARIRVRGMNSISLNNEPIWVIDGVRMTSNNESFSTITGNGASGNTGGNNASRVGDLNPDEIESIEIVKGPSAATLYGTDAANGVVVVTTKRGLAGAPRWNLYGEGGLIKDRNDYPTAYTLFGTRTDGVSPTAPSFCNLQRVGTGLCQIDSVGALNLFKEDDLTPLGTGNRRQGGVQVSGGTDVLRYFVAGENENEVGVLELPEFERNRFESENLPLHPWTDRPNAMERNSLRVNLNASPAPSFDLSAQTNFIGLRQRYTLESNSTAGLGSHLFGGPGYRDNGTIPGTDDPLNGYRGWTPGYMWQEKTQQSISRYIWAMNANYRPTTWLASRATVGRDFTMRSDENLLLRGEGPPLTANTRLGSRGVSRVNLDNFTADFGATATFNPMAWLNSKTTGGVQYVNYSLRQAQTGARQLAPGSQSVESGAELVVGEATVLQKTFGVFVEQAVALNDRLFLTGAVRSDQNSAFGTDFQRVFYPKFSASWLISDESFWRAPAFLQSLRLRFAYGQSGVQPRPNDALRYDSAATTNVADTDVSTVVFANLGDPNLKPERSGEFEGGFEAQFFQGRLGLDFTYYYKKTRDALIEKIVPPSKGIITRQLANLGAVRNEGIEVQLNAQPIDRQAFAWDLNVSGSLNDNKVLSLGDTPPQIGNASRIVEGYPVGGLWARPITGWQDKNNDGLLTYYADDALNEVFIGDSVIFRGYSSPRYSATLTSGFDLLNRTLRFQTLFDYRGGNRWFNDTERLRCQRPNCQGRNNPDAPFELQAANIARLENPATTLDGYFMSGAFVRLREASLQYSVSPSVARRLFRARSASFIVTGRNLALWTDYLGTDPETGFNLTNTGTEVPADFQTLSAPSYFTFRINLGY